MTVLAARSTWRTTSCLFILSTGRTGSSTLVHLLNLVPKVSAFHEPKPILLRFNRRAYAEAHSRQGRYGRLFARARRGQIGRVGRSDGIYAEATLLKFFAPVMAGLLPHARFLHLHRHPAEVVRSAMRRRWFRDNGLDRYRIVPLAGDAAHRQWERWSAFRKACWTWHAENEYFLDLARTAGPGRVLELAFEEWTRQGTGAYRRIFEFIGVEPPREDAVAGVLGVRHNEQSSGEFPTYDRWPHEWRQVLIEIAGGTMARLGYEP